MLQAALANRGTLWAMPEAQLPARQSDPAPEFAPAMRALPPRWQKAVMALFATGGNQSRAYLLAGFVGKNDSPSSPASSAVRANSTRLFVDPRIRAAIREYAICQIDISEPEVMHTVLEIMRNANERGADRLKAAAMIWDRAAPVVNKLKVDVEHHLSVNDLDIKHYRALQRLGAPRQAFIDRFGANGLARVEALVVADDLRQKQIEGPTIDAEYEEAKDD